MQRNFQKCPGLSEILQEISGILINKRLRLPN
jgi:hypothetical protein